jgi:VRR-NUC domain
MATGMITQYPSEHEEQVAVFDWAETIAHQEPLLNLMFAIPNGGARHIGVARKMKAEGVKPGVPDIFLPVARQGYHGLWIEMKRIKGKLTPRQKQWIDNMLAGGYLAVCCRGADEAIDVIEKYMQIR